MNCPICTQALEGGELVMVCKHCHRGLGGGGLSVHTTGEFRIPTAAEIAEHVDDQVVAGSHQVAGGAGERIHATNVCSWCGKLESQVKKLLGRNNVALCDECVALCVDILDAELGTWR